MAAWKVMCKLCQSLWRIAQFSCGPRQRRAPSTTANAQMTNPFLETTYVVHATDDLLGRYVERYHGDLARLVPELHDRVGVLHPPRAAEAAAERYLLFEAVVGLVAMIAELAPVVLVLDDLHWGSASDLQLLKHIVRAAPDLRLLVIGTFRDSDIGADHSLTSLLADLRREDHVHRCMLTGIASEI